MSRLDPDLYTVAWFAPLEIEAQAALHMLDKRHQGGFPMGRGDDYVFQAGDMCGHNVIIATLPAGQEYGTGSAAALASHVKKFFPNLWFGLLVGVAAGLPNFSRSPPLDIRLGDVLVGLPTGESVGIIAYELGKDTGRDGFQLLRSGNVLANTETVVRSAIGSIKLSAPNDAGVVLPYYESIKYKEHSTGTFVDPGQENDTLYQVDDDGNERLMERQRRPDSKRTRVWYGSIGSGDKLVKNARKGNELRDKHNIIGLEMEAAGTMNRIPVGVIRGVCDYGDEHKNKKWQPYAAAMASAYAKAVLSKILPRTPSNGPVALQNVAPRTMAMDNRVEKHRLDEEYPTLVTDDRRKKHRGCKEVAEVPSSNDALTAQSISGDGHGVQVTGSTFSVGGNLTLTNGYRDRMASPNRDSSFPDDLWREFLGDLFESDPSTDMSRIEDEKGGLLRDCFDWILQDTRLKGWRENKDTRLLWIKGDPGKGKTMLMIGLIENLTAQLVPHASTVLSFFFCQNMVPHLNNGVSVLRGILWKLLNRRPTMYKYIPDVYKHSAKEKRKGLFDQSNLNALSVLKKMLSDILKDDAFDVVYILVDALDECDKYSENLVEWIARNAADPLSKAKWLVSGRSDPRLEETFRPDNKLQKLNLELNYEPISQAVSLFIKCRVEWLAKKKRYNEYDEGLQKTVEKKLVEKAESTFLWVALVCQSLAKIPRRETLVQLDKFPLGLQPLYDRMMQLIEDQEGSSKKLCKQILRATAVVYRPLIREELILIAELPNEKKEDIDELIELCGSYLIIREETIRFVHQSAKDYLKGVAEFFPGGQEEEHGRISKRSLQAMSKILKKDIYSLRHLGYPAQKVHPPDPDPLSPVRYSCSYWINHLLETSEEYRGHDTRHAIKAFFNKHLLHWLEALSLTGGISNTAAMISKLVDVFSQSADQHPYDGNSFYSLVRDAHRFIHYHKWPIENSPLQVYASALVFSPARSLIRELFTREEPEWITTKPVMQSDWSPCLQILEGHSKSVESVTFSHDDKYLASASEDGTVKVWDSASGKCLQTLEGHSREVVSVTFSHDDKHLASASEDGTVKVWDSASGKCLQTLEGHSEEVNSVAFSQDDKHLASASWDNTRIWDSASGKCLQILEGHSRGVMSVAFSHDDKHLASASWDETIRIWDSASGKCLQTLEGHSVAVNSVTFSQDDKHLASASDDGTVRIWDPDSRKCLQILEGHSGGVMSVTFSQDDKHLASASRDGTVRIWDSASGKCLQTLEGHSEAVNSVAFSQDDKYLASASRDGTVRIWDSVSRKCLQALEGHSKGVTSVAFLHDNKYLASASWDKTIRIWDSASGKCLQTLEGHSKVVMSVTFSHDDKHLASVSLDGTIRIWDSASGKCLQTLEGHSEGVMSVAFSQDDKHLASASLDGTVRIWDPASGKCLQILEGDSKGVMSVAFSHDNKYLASASWDNPIRIWDSASGKCLQTLEGHSKVVRSVTFSHDDKHLASASWDDTVRIWDSASGKCLQGLDISKALRNISFDTADQYLHTEIGAILLNVPSASSTVPGETIYQKPQYRGLGISSDGTWITYNSENLLWIPQEYRPSESGVTASTIAIGRKSGRVLILNFDTQLLS